MDAGRRTARSWLERALRTPFEAVLEEAKVTPRQRDVIRLKFSEGLLNYQIAAKLNISPETVRDELARAYDHISRVLADI